MDESTQALTKAGWKDHYEIKGEDNGGALRHRRSGPARAAGVPQHGPRCVDASARNPLNLRAQSTVTASSDEPLLSAPTNPVNQPQPLFLELAGYDRHPLRKWPAVFYED